MKINGLVVNTPHDPGIGIEFDPDWRRKAAVAWADGRWFPPRHIFDDATIHNYVHYLQWLKRKGDRAVPARFADIADAEAWYFSAPSGLKNILECLLLSGVEMQYVGMDLVPMLTNTKLGAAGYDKVMRVIKIYERLFFNIRHDDGTLNQSIHTRTHFALAGVPLDERISEAQLWRVMAAYYGYTAFVYACHNLKHAHGKLMDPRSIMQLMMQESQIVGLGRLVTKAINNFDMTLLLGKNIEYEKMLFDTKASTGEKDLNKELVLAMMQLTSPKLVAANQSEADRMLTDKAYHDEYQARKNIAAQTVKDSGVEAGVKEWGKVKDNNLSDQGFTK